MKKKIFLLSFGFLFSLISYSQVNEKSTIAETLDYLNKTLKNNPPDTLSYFEIDVNYYGQLIIFLHKKPYIGEISTFSRSPINSVKVGPCSPAGDMITINCNNNQNCIISYTDKTPKYAQSFIKFDKKSGSCENIRKALEHLLTLVLADPLYHDKEFTTEEKSSAPKAITPAKSGTQTAPKVAPKKK